MRRRLLGNRRSGGSDFQELVNPTFTLDKSVDIASKFGISNAFQDCVFSTDYQYFFIGTGGGANPQHVLNVVDINDINTWTLKETSGPIDFRGIYINNDGTKFYGGVTSNITQWNLSTPYLLASRVGATGLSAGGTGLVGGLEMNPEENKLFVMRTGTSAGIREFDLETNGNIAGATLVQEKFLIPLNTTEKGLKFINNGNGVMTANFGQLDFTVKIRTVSSPYTLNDLSAPNTRTLPQDGATGIELNSSQTKAYTVTNTGLLRQYSITEQ